MTTIRLARSISFVTLGMAIWFVSARAQTYSLLYTFTGGPEGGYPAQRLTVDSVGNIYGSTDDGGGPSGCGTIFKIRKGDRFSVLYTFLDRADGCDAHALIRDGSGNIYGTASFGGQVGCGNLGCGTVFKLDKKGNFTPLYTFTGGTDGANPYGGLVRDAAGNLYGATPSGGAYGYGDVFKLDTTYHLTVLYAFTGGTDGGFPLGSMVRDAAGNLYGNTQSGGDLTCGSGNGSGCGTVFKLDTKGNLTVLHTFSGGADGAFPGTVIQIGTNLYGTTQNGGDLACVGARGIGCGVVFRIDGKRTFTVLYTFGGGADGSEAGANGWGAALARDQNGNLYGATSLGGDLNCIGSNKGCGTVFRLDPTGKLTVLYDFTGETDGTPTFYGTDLVRDQAGNLYGVTVPLGNGSLGTVFRIAP